MDARGGGDEAVQRATTALLDALPQAALLTEAGRGVLRALNRSAALLRGRGTDLQGPLGLADTLFRRDVGRGAFEDVLGVVLGGGSWDGELALTPRRGCRAGVARVRPVRGGSVTGGGLARWSRRWSWWSTGAAARGRTAVRAADPAGPGGRGAGRRRDLDTSPRSWWSTWPTPRAPRWRRCRCSSTTTRSALIGIRGGRQGVEKRWATYSGAPADARRRRGAAGHGSCCSRAGEIRTRYPDLETAAEGERSIACLPLRIGEPHARRRDDVVPRPPVVSPAELEFLSVMADTCAQAIQRVRMTEEAADQGGQAPVPRRLVGRAVAAASTTSRRWQGGPAGGAVVRRLVRDRARPGRRAAHPRGRPRGPGEGGAGRGVRAPLPADPDRDTGGLRRCSAPVGASSPRRSPTR